MRSRGFWESFRRYAVTLFFSFGLLQSVQSSAAATLMWDANTPVPAGYKVYYSALPEIPLQLTNVASSTSLDLGFLLPGSTYLIYVTAYNEAGLESDPSSTIEYSPTGPVLAPSILTGPATQNVNLGGTITLTVQATGSAPLAYQWLKNGTPISGATSATFSKSAVQALDAGSYTVQVSNSAGSVTSSAATITVIIPPAITLQPVGQNIILGSTLTLSVQATGSAPLAYQWMKNGIAISGATSATYSKSVVQAIDVGSYTVQISNEAGSVTSSAAVISIIGLPTITLQPVSQSIPLGSALALSIEASGTGPLAYQWLKNGVPISGATSATFSRSAVQATDGGSYQVEVSNAAGSVTSAAAVITIITPPTITLQPFSQSVNFGGTLALSVQAAGSGLSYQWLKEGSPISGATSAAYTKPSMQSTDAGSYAVQISNVAGSITSSAAVVTVVTPPAITLQPVSQSITLGGALVLSVEATGTGPLSYQWLIDGAAIPGAAAATFSISEIRQTDAGAYSVQISNSAGSVTSASAAVNVVALPTIVTHPSSQTLNLGGAATLAVQVTGAGPFSYRWSKDGATLAGATGTTYSITSAETNHAGIYKVHVSNAAGSVSSEPATINVFLPGAPVIASQPTSTNVNAGSLVNLRVEASGSGVLTYQWFKNNSSIAGATSAAYAITSAQAADAGSYSVQVSNAGGSTTSESAIVTVVTPPTITMQPLGQTVTYGSKLTLSVQATGSTLAYRWMKDGVTIGAPSSASYSLFGIDSSHAGIYTVEVSNGAGSVISAPATILVSAPEAPAILRQPASLQVDLGAPLILTVEVSGGGTLAFQWLKRGSAISGETNQTFSIASAQISDAGIYSVRVSNVAGSVTSEPATVIVGTAPVITLQPVGTNAPVGASVLFAVEASGSGPLTYQWMLAGIPISNATNSSYTITLVQYTQAGSYSVQVSNPVGSVASEPALLNVVGAPVIVTQPLSQTVLAGTALQLTVVATGPGTLTYRWFKDGAPLAGATSATYSVASVTALHAGHYAVEVSGGTGSVMSRSAVITVNAQPSPATLELSLVSGQLNYAEINLSGAQGTYEIQSSPALGSPWQIILQTNITGSARIPITLGGAKQGFFRTVRIGN